MGRLLRFLYFCGLALVVLGFGAMPAVCQAGSTMPGAGIVVDDQGQVYIADTSRGVLTFDQKGRMRQLHSCKYPWMAIDRKGAFSSTQPAPFLRITPDGARP